MTHACTGQDIKTCRKTLSIELKKANREKERNYRKQDRIRSRASRGGSENSIPVVEKIPRRGKRRIER